MKKLKSNVIMSTIGAIIAIVLMAIAIYFAGAKSYFVDNNSNGLDTMAGNVKIYGSDIVSTAVKLVGKPYAGGKGSNKRYRII